MNRRAFSYKSIVDTIMSTGHAKTRIDKSFAQLTNLVNLGFGVAVAGRRSTRFLHPCQRFHPARGVNATSGLPFTEEVFQELVDRAGRIIYSIQERLEPWVALIDQFFETLFVLFELLMARFMQVHFFNLASVRTKPPPIEYHPTIQPNAPAL